MTSWASPEVAERLQRIVDNSDFVRVRVEIRDPFGTPVCAMEFHDLVPGLGTFIMAATPDQPEIRVALPAGDPRAPYSVVITAT